MSPAARSLSAALALVAVAAVTAAVVTSGPRPSPRLPERLAVAPRSTPPAAPPTARDILGRGSALALTAQQRHELASLDRRWQGRARALTAAVDEAARELSAFMAEAAGARAVPLRDIRERAAVFSARSAELREERTRHAEAALALLTESQGHGLHELHPTTKGRGGTHEDQSN